MIVDTHSHIYDEAFDADRREVLDRAQAAGVGMILLPAIDSRSHARLFGLAREEPGICRAMIGLHPTSVNDNPDFRDELRLVEQYLESPPQGVMFCAVGEVGLDLYWSRDFESQQVEALRYQAELAIKYDLPLVVHTRDAWERMHEVLGGFSGCGLRGVMHSFSGTFDDYMAVRAIGDFCLGIGGPVTYKRSALAEILPKMEVDDILLETDSPYLPPVPHRGERNQSAYLPLVRDKVAELYGLSAVEVERITTANAVRMFRL